MNTRWRILVGLAISVAIGIGFAGCENESETMPNTERGTVPHKGFRVEITDGPANYSRMDLQIKGVSVYHTAEGWIPLNTTVRSINILSLSAGVTATLAIDDEVPVGQYSYVRIWFGDRNAVTVNTPIEVGGLFIDAGGVAPLTWKLDSPFVDVKIDKTVNDEHGASVLLDFDAQKSVVEDAEALWLSPVINVMVHRLTGAMGNVNGGAAPAFVGFYNQNHAFSAYATPTGKFLVRGMMPGNYQMIIRVMKRNSDGVMEEITYTRDDVRVTLGNYTDLGQIDL